MRVLTVILLATTTLAAQLPPPPPPMPRPNPQGMPPRDPALRADPVGTGMIRGRVVAADSGNPIRRATVNIAAAPPTATLPPPGATPVTTTTRTVIVNGMAQTVAGPVPVAIRNRTVTTDAEGNFEFAGLPAGSYRLFANAGQYSAAYLQSAYGAKRPSTPVSQDGGTPIELADGQKFEKAVIALPRGAVITGRVTDDNGEPMARVQLYTMFMAPGSTRGQRTGGNAQTDDLGQFRMFGLQPGDYMVVAEARGPTFVQPNAPPESEDDKIGFLTTYFPGTPDEGAAQRVRTRAGGETPGVEIRMVSGRLFRLSGVVTDSQGRSSSRTNGSLVKTLGGAGSTNFGFSTDETGRFQMRNIPPGSYRLVIRGRAAGPEGGDPNEMAVLPLTINSDVEGIVVMTSAGATISGQVVFEQGPPQLSPAQSSFQMRVNATPGDPSSMNFMPGPQPAVVAPDLTFQLKGIMPGELLLRSNAPNQVVKAVMLGAEDITDTPREFKNGDRVTIVMTSRMSTVEGNVTDEKGAPVTDAGILIFSDDKGSWRYNSVRTKRGGSDANGHFKVTGLLPGRYYAVAAPRERMNISSLNQDPTFFEQLAKDGTTIVVGEDETRQVDLKLAPLPSGG